MAKTPSPCIDVCKFKRDGHCIGCSMNKAQKSLFTDLKKDKHRAAFVELLVGQQSRLGKYRHWVPKYLRKYLKKKVSGEVRPEEPREFLVFLTSCNAQIFGQGITRLCCQLTGTGQRPDQRFLCREQRLDHVLIAGVAVMFLDFGPFNQSGQHPFGMDVQHANAFGWIVLGDKVILVHLLEKVMPVTFQ